MTKAITLRESKNLSKYLICDQEKRTLYCITDNSDSAAVKAEIQKKVNFDLTSYQLQIISDLSLKEELFLIWPQIIKDFEVYFSFSITG